MLKPAHLYRLLTPGLGLILVTLSACSSPSSPKPSLQSNKGFLADHWLGGIRGTAGHWVGTSQCDAPLAGNFEVLLEIRSGFESINGATITVIRINDNNLQAALEKLAYKTRAQVHGNQKAVFSAWPDKKASALLKSSLKLVLSREPGAKTLEGNMQLRPRGTVRADPACSTIKFVRDKRK